MTNEFLTEEEKKEMQYITIEAFYDDGFDALNISKFINVNVEEVEDVFKQIKESEEKKFK